MWEKKQVFFRKKKKKTAADSRNGNLPPDFCFVAGVEPAVLRFRVCCR